MGRTARKRDGRLRHAVVILLTFACFQVSLSAYQAVALNSAIDAAVLSADFSKAVASGDVASEVREEILAKNATLSDAGLAVESAEVRWTTSRTRRGRRASRPNG